MAHYLTLHLHRQGDRMTQRERRAEYLELTIIAVVILVTAIWIVATSAR